MASDAPRSVADTYLELLLSRGVEYLFGNGGTDFGPLIDAHARRVAAGEPVPQPVAITHEITAMAMAHGYGMVSGKTPAVMVHTVAGTANSIGGLINASRARVPMYFTAGRTPLTEGDILGARDTHIHWAQESFDQGGMVREWVKWDYELKAGSNLGNVVDRAFAVAESEPCGPVYLTLPREVLAADDDGVGFADEPTMRAGESVAAPDAVAVAVDALARADNPIIITRSAGRDPGAPAELARLAEQLGAPVFDQYPTHSNLDFDHPLRLSEAPDRLLGDADVVIVVESDVPWTPKRAQPRSSATVIAVGPDPLHSRYAVRSFPVDVNLTGSTRLTLSALVDRLDGRLDAPAVQTRTARWTDHGAAAREGARSRAEAGGTASTLQKPYFSRVLDELLPEDAIIVDELGTDSSQLTLRGPGRFYGVSQAGVLGWGIGAGLGAKLAAPDRTVVSVVGDGSYLFGVPTTVHWASRRYDLPVLYLVWNNAKWGAVERAARLVYPDGHAVRNDSFTFSDLQPSIDYELVCQAAGGMGERVDDPADLPSAIERGLKAVADGRQALLNLVAHE
ncbi:MAG: thiamine pyrophosphate-requiring protein [Actinomycetota bacterium]|nr:thiamine pyrophosphate-requiring protein [Actinomycetota bacterium]